MLASLVGVERKKYRDDDGEVMKSFISAVAALRLAPFAAFAFGVSGVRFLLAGVGGLCS